jgi:hypothetical protein
MGMADPFIVEFSLENPGLFFNGILFFIVGIDAEVVGVIIFDQINGKFFHRFSF